jgi:hypothetical protein
VGTSLFCLDSVALILIGLSYYSRRSPQLINSTRHAAIHGRTTSDFASPSAPPTRLPPEGDRPGRRRGMRMRWADGYSMQETQVKLNSQFLFDRRQINTILQSDERAVGIFGAVYVPGHAARDKLSVPVNLINLSTVKFVVVVLRRVAHPRIN